jgi:glycosyltransferase involved in cell wall biosynthesis
MLADQPVAIVTPRYGRDLGGVERYVERLAGGLSKRGLAVEVLALDSGLAPPLELIDGVTVRRFAATRIAGEALPSRDLYRWLVSHAESYSVVNAHNLHSLLPALATAALRRARPPLVLTPHWHGTGHTAARRLLHLPYRPLAMWTARAADAVICNSIAERDLVRQQLGPRNKVVVIPEGVELPHRTSAAPAASEAGQRPPLSADSSVLLAVGRLEGYKGTERIIRALPYLPGNYQLVVIGTGPALDALVAATTIEHVSDRVHFLGRCSDEELASWYDTAAACISLSSQESFGLVVLEAAAAGCPVVVSDIPVHRDLASFVPAERFTFVSRDAGPQALALAISQGVRRGRIGKADQASAGGWHVPTWEHLVDEVIAVFAEVANDRRSR